ncbi:hypothetical protein B0H12DRAFT_1125871 [Mycena haematopus]|nr:hypothetical protein B0H12DRAFT_1125871 [Mycena haematopus]
MDTQNTGLAFPPEMEHEIFRTTAVLHPTMIPTLLRVAHRVHAWTEPLLYTNLRISACETKGVYDEALLRALDRKPPDFFSTTARRIALSTMSMNFFGMRTKNPWSTPELERMLRACTGITALLVFGNLLDPPVLRLVAHMRPTRVDLMGNLVRAFTTLDFSFSLPFFERVSQLLLCDIDDELTPTWSHWPALSRLPALTHVAVFRADLVPVVLATLPRLEVVVLCAAKLDAEAADRRVVVIEIDDFWADWHQGADLWMCADAKRSQGCARP